MSALAEFSVVPVGMGESVSRYVAECIRIIESSGLEYQLTSMGTVLEGEVDDILPVILRCHNRIMEMTNRVVTSIKIDDRKGRKGAIEGKVRSVREKL